MIFLKCVTNDVNLRLKKRSSETWGISINPACCRKCVVKETFLSFPTTENMLQSIDENNSDTFIWVPAAQALPFDAQINELISHAPGSSQLLYLIGCKLSMYI